MATAAVLDRALDRPAHGALTGPQAALAQGGHGAWRIDPAYGPFAAADPGCEAAIAALLRGADDEVWLIEPQPCTPPDTQGLRQAALAQMLATGPAGAVDDAGIVALGIADVPDMTALALATRPGPWGPSTWRYGRFYGIRAHGRLIAMAGERLRPTAGVIEVSAVCTDPAHRGQGLAARLIRRVMAGHRAQGCASFLHSYPDNAAALALYRSLGFVHRADLVASIVTLPS